MNRRLNLKNRLTAALLILLTTGMAHRLGAEVVTFQFAGHLFQTGDFSGLAVNDPFTGSFSYTREQPGLNIPLIIPGQQTRYVLDRFTLVLRNQTVNATAGQIDIGNDQLPWADHPYIRWDLVDMNCGLNVGTPLSGAFDGVPVTNLELRLVNTAGQPFSDTSLPTNLVLSDFAPSAYLDLTFSGPFGSVAGYITSLQLVPEPTVASLFLLASGLLGITARRSAKAAQRSPRA